MDLPTAIIEFRKKITNPLCEDIRRTLEVTCHSPGPNNHGSNFLGNMVVLIGIETVARFTNSTKPDVQAKFKEDANSLYEKLDSESRRLLLPRYEPDDSAGSRLAILFIKKYFDKRFSEEQIIDRQVLADVVWKFRNAHAHNYYPFISKKNRGRVLWLYADPDPSKLVGVSIADIEADMDRYARCLCSFENGWFSLCPQMLFVYFKRAIDSYLESLESDAVAGA